MISVNMAALWGDDVEQIVKGITEVTNNVKIYHALPNVSRKMFMELCKDIGEIRSFWTGHTYIGCPKNEAVKIAFQSFFEELMRLLLDMKNSRKSYETRVASKCLYRGKVYRYLGNDHPTDAVVRPIYDSIYVSWSKEPKNDYLLSKLYGTITWMSCEINAPFYGIDLDALGCSRANEHEVVFPTIEECITEIKYISEETDDKT